MAFKKGHKLAPGGARPNSGRPADWLREQCRKHAPDILDFLRQVSLGEDVEQVITENGETVRVPAPVRERIKASEILLDRGYGKSEQPVDVTSSGSELTPLPTAALLALVQALKAGEANGGSGK